MFNKFSNIKKFLQKIDYIIVYVPRAIPSTVQRALYRNVYLFVYVLRQRAFLNNGLSKRFATGLSPSLNIKALVCVYN